MHIKDIIDTRPDPAPAWVAYPGSRTFQVLARPIGNRLQEFTEQAQEIDWDTATMTRVIKTNQEKFARLFCDWVIVDWKGLAFEDLRRLILIKDMKLARDLSGPIACDEDARLLLFKHSQAFNTWIRSVANDVERFNQEREDQAEKKQRQPSTTSLTSQGSTAGNAGKTSRRMALSRIAAPVRLPPGTTPPTRPWPCTTWPALTVSWWHSGWKRALTFCRSQTMSGHCMTGLWRHCTAR